MASKGKSDHYHREAPQPTDGDVARIQMGFMLNGAEGTFVDEPRAKATVLMVICKDDGNLSATEVRAKTVLRFLSTYEGVEIKTDGEPSIVEIARRLQARRDKQRLWHRRVLEDTKIWNSAGLVASVLLGCARTHESESHSRYTVVSMDVAAFSVDGGALPVRSEKETDSV